MSNSFKIGDIVVIEKLWTRDEEGPAGPTKRRFGVDHSHMPLLIGKVGVVVPPRELATRVMGSGPLSECLDDNLLCKVRTYDVAHEVGWEEPGWYYYADGLRLATEEEKRSFLLIHLIRKES